MRVILEQPWVVTGLLRDPLLLAWVQISLELAVVLADDSFGWIVEPIANIVGALGNGFGSVDIVTNQCLAIRSETLELLGVKPPILDGAVVPFFVFELEVVVEVVLALNQLALVPFCNVATLITETVTSIFV